MYTLDKIKQNVPSQIINTINECVNLQEKEILENWLKDCKQEITRRQEAKENTYPLFYEKAYLEMMLQ